MFRSSAVAAVCAATLLIACGDSGARGNAASPGSHVASSSASAVADLEQTGPFAVGFTYDLSVDPSRPGDGATYANRPIPVYVWYPVDPATITPSTPLARYSIDPLYVQQPGAPAGGLPDALSSDLEKYGIDRAYAAPTASALRPFPLLIFSPGAGIPAWRHVSLGARLASHGFVVAAIQHYAEGDQWWPWAPFAVPISTMLFNRPLDASFVLTDLLQKSATPGHVLESVIREDQVAVGGWSLGGYTAVALTGGDDSACEGPFGLLDDPAPSGTCVAATRDPRFKAIVPLDGANQYLLFHELSRVTVPSLSMGEEWTTLAAQGIPAWQARQHAAFSGHPNYRVDVANANHQSFADVCEDARVLGDLGVWPATRVQQQLNKRCVGVIPSGEAHALVGKYVIAFLKTHLAGQTGYEYILTPGYAIARDPRVEFFVTEPRSPRAAQESPEEFVYFPHQAGSEQFVAAKEPQTKPLLESDATLE